MVCCVIDVVQIVMFVVCLDIFLCCGGMYVVVFFDIGKVVFELYYV